MVTVDANTILGKAKFKNTKELNSIKYTTYIWSYKIKYDHFMTERVV